MYKIPVELKTCYFEFMKAIDDSILIDASKQKKTNILMIVKDMFGLASMSKIISYISKISLRMLIEFGDEVDLSAILKDKNISAETLKICFKKFKLSYNDDYIALLFAKNKNTPIYILDKLINSYQNSHVYEAALKNKKGQDEAF